jgi:hypothetical protein
MVCGELALAVAKTGQIHLVRSGEELKMTTCCPTASQNRYKIVAGPQRTPHQPEEPGKAVRPVAEVGEVSKQVIGEKGHLHLLAVALDYRMHAAQAGKLFGDGAQIKRFSCFGAAGVFFVELV